MAHPEPRIFGRLSIPPSRWKTTQTVHGRPPRACGLAIERTRSLVGPLADITRVAGNGRFRGQSGQPENARIADIGMSAACQMTHDMEMIARN